MLKTNMTRRTFFKKTFRAFIAFFAFSGFGYSYARYVEPSSLKIETFSIIHRDIPKGFHGKKILQFSDIHLGHYFTLEQLDDLIETINKQAPDIILFTGDLMDAPNEYMEQEKIPPILRKLHAPLGKFAIYGNHDHGGYGSDMYKKIIEESNITLLVNSSFEIFATDNDSIIIAGLDDALLGRPNITETFKNIDPNKFTVLAVHEPDVAEQLASFPISLQLSGHSHGGQVKLPFFGPIYTPVGALTYIEGFYTINQKSDYRLYVNRGIGTTRLPFRFLTKPEISIFTLYNEELSSN